MARILPVLKQLRRILSDDYAEYEKQNSWYRQFWSDSRDAVPTIHVEGKIEPTGIKLIGQLFFSSETALPKSPDALNATLIYKEQGVWHINYVYHIPLDTPDLVEAFEDFNQLIEDYLESIATLRGFPFDRPEMFMVPMKEEVL